VPVPHHEPVLLEEVDRALAPSLEAAPLPDPDRPEDSAPRVLVDGTLGLAGHAVRLAAGRPHVRLVGIDRDPQALAEAAGRLDAAGIRDRTVLVEATFDDAPASAAVAGNPDAVLLDLGVSSLQLDSDERGFAYSRDTPLDMRMGTTGPTAADVLNSYPAARLERVLRDFGDERFARSLANAVAAERAQRPLRTTGQLVDLIYRTVPAPARRTGGHPAKRTFQALRIEVNDELGSLSRGVELWADRLRPGGRLAVITYHSGEDRIVKRAFTARARVEVLRGVPVEPPAPDYRVLAGGGVVPTAAEIAANPRAASARLRVLVRHGPDAAAAADPAPGPPGISR
jgi:16S rRNA (cytosine1402-N4)-methyltransferase